MRASSVCIGVLCAPCICIGCLLSVCCSSRWRQNTPSEEKTRFERRQKSQPRPLGQRKRALTITSSHVGADGQPSCAKSCERLAAQQITHDQRQSRFFRLPGELREMIYGYVLGHAKLHIIRKETKLGHLRCRLSDQCPVPYGSLRCWRGIDHDGFWMPSLEFGPASDGDIIPLLRTCRQVYTEALPVVYTSNAFSFNDLDSLRYFACTIPTHRFNSIRNVELQWAFNWPYFLDANSIPYGTLYPPHDEASWDGVWKVISDMKGLTSIRLKIECSRELQSDANEAMVLAPLWSVTNISEFDVFLPWGGKEYSDAPFRVIRPCVDEDEGSEADF